MMRDCAALERHSNRYTLCRLTTAAARRLHRPRTRVQDTLNQVLSYLAGSRALRCLQAIPKRCRRPR